MESQSKNPCYEKSFSNVALNMTAVLTSTWTTTHTDTHTHTHTLAPTRHTHTNPASSIRYRNSRKAIDTLCRRNFKKLTFEKQYGHRDRQVNLSPVPFLFRADLLIPFLLIKTHSAVLTLEHTVDGSHRSNTQTNGHRQADWYRDSQTEGQTYRDKNTEI